MIGVIDETKNREAFFHVAADVVKYIHFGAFDSVAEIVDNSYMPIKKIEKFFSENRELVPDSPSRSGASSFEDAFRYRKINDQTYEVECDFVRGEKKAYMTMCLQFVYDREEPYITVIILDIRKN